MIIYYYNINFAFCIGFRGIFSGFFKGNSRTEGKKGLLWQETPAEYSINTESSFPTL